MINQTTYKQYDEDGHIIKTLSEKGLKEMNRQSKNFMKGFGLPKEDIDNLFSNEEYWKDIN